jgi:hypothetical protein
MDNVKVYKFKIWDQFAARHRVAYRMATLKFIEMAKGVIIEGTEREIDRSLLNVNEQAPINIQPLA